MPLIFKTLASIAAWILFVFGCLSLLGGLMRTVGASAFGTPDLALIAVYFGYGILSLILSVVAMKLRHMMD